MFYMGVGNKDLRIRDFHAPSGRKGAWKKFENQNGEDPLSCERFGRFLKFFHGSFREEQFDFQLRIEFHFQLEQSLYDIFGIRGLAGDECRLFAIVDVTDFARDTTSY